MARTIDAKFYCFDIFFNEKLKLFDCLSDIMDICCNHHLLAFTNKGEVYAWVWNHFQQIHVMELILQRYQIKIDRFDGQKLISISRGFSHSIALTESGRVFSWNQINSLNKPTKICEDSLNEHSFEILIKFCIQFLFLFEMFSQIGESTVEFGVTGLLSNKYFLFSEYGIFRTKRRKNYTLLHIFTEIKTLN
jgi:hypothetical protein